MSTLDTQKILFNLGISERKKQRERDEQFIAIKEPIHLFPLSVAVSPSLVHRNGDTDRLVIHLYKYVEVSGARREIRRNKKVA